MQSTFPSLHEAIQQGMSIGYHIGAQVHVRRNGEVVADFAVGAAEVEPYSELRPDQRMLWLSAGKPLTAMAIGILTDRGRLTFETNVSELIPEFDRHGKGSITLKHLLTHTHAYRPPAVDWPRLSRAEIIEKICDALPVDGVSPGEYAGYDPQTNWYLLSEIVERVTGTPNHLFVQDEILAPLGCTTASIGMSMEEWTTLRNAGELAVLHDTTGAARERIDLRPASEGQFHEGDITADHVHFPTPWVGDDALRAAAHNPGGGAVGTAADLSLIYQCLLNDGTAGDGTSLLRPETVAQMTKRQRRGLKDNSFNQVIDWGFGFLINSALYGSPALPYSYGKHASENTFGHGGMQSSAGFADPEHKLAVGIIFNGLPGEPKHMKRINEVVTALYVDLNLNK